MSENFVIEILSLAVFFVINYLKLNSDFKKTRKKSENSHDYLIKKIDNLEIIVKTDISKRELKKELSDRISLTSLNIISANSDLNSDTISILNVLSENIIKVAIKYHSSIYRKNKDLIKNYINIQIKSVLDKNKLAINDIIPEKKDNLGIMEFIRKYNPEITVNTNTLKQRLYENKLNDNEYIKLFDNFIKNQFIYIIKGLRKWNST